jgi:tetratricopeptide (TPR) repeat protein
MKYLIKILIILSSVNISNAVTTNFSEIKRAAVQWIQMGRYKPALNLLEDYKNENPHDCRIYMEIADYYKRKNNTQKIESIYLEGIDKAKQSECRNELFYKLAKFYYYNGKYNNVIEYLDKYIKSIGGPKSEPGFQDTYKLMGISYYLLAETNLDKAEECLRKHIKNNFNDYEAYRYLSKVCDKLNKKDYSKAYKDIGNLLVLKKNISESDLSYEKAHIFAMYKKYRDTKTNLRRIYDERWNDIKLNFNIGLASLLIEEYGDAVKYFEKAVKYYEDKFSLKKSFNNLFGIDTRGARYLMMLQISYFFNKNNPDANKTEKKLKEYNESYHEKYKSKRWRGKDSKFDKELEGFWEY